MNVGGAAAQTDVLLSESAIRRIKELSSGQPTTSMLRLAVDAGGCSGFQYSFTLATPEEVRLQRTFDCVEVQPFEGNYLVADE